MPLTVKPKLRSRKLPKALKDLSRMNVQLNRVGVKVLKQVRRNCSGRYLQRRSGDLYKSWDKEIRPLPNHGYRLVVYSDLGKAPYARIHDLGGWTGRGHKTHLRARKYATQAWYWSYDQVKRIMKKYMVEMFRG